MGPTCGDKDEGMDGRTGNGEGTTSLACCVESVNSVGGPSGEKSTKQLKYTDV